MKYVLLFIFGLTLSCRTLLAQPSLAGEDQTSFDIKVDGQNTPVSVIRDARIPDKWYYIPNKPRLVMEKIGAKERPAISLTRFQFTNIVDTSKEDAGGWLTMSVTFSLPAPSLADLKSQLEKKHNGGKPILLDAMPLTNSKAYFFSTDPSDTKDKDGPVGKFIDASFGGQDKAPRFASQHVGFSVFLNKNGADLVNQGMLDNKLPVWIMLEYQGLTPKLGVTITGNWTAFQKHYSSNTKFAAQASYFGLFGGGTNLDWKSVREELVKSGSIKIEAVTGEGFKQEDVDRYLQPILKMLLDGIAEDFKPKQITPAVAEPAKAGGRFFSAGYSRAEKKEEYQKKGTFTMDFSSRSIATAQPTWIHANLGIRGFQETDHVTQVKNKLWETAYLKMPDIPTSIELNIVSMHVKVALKNAKGEKLGDQILMSWEKKAPQWKDQRGSSANPYAFFPLFGLNLKEADFKGANFDVELKVVREAFPPLVPEGNEYVFKSIVPVSSGAEGVGSFWQGFQMITLDARAVSFKNTDAGSKLTQLIYDIEIDGKKESGTFKPYNNDGKFVSPPPRIWLVERSKNKPINKLVVTAEVDGKFQDPTEIKLQPGQTTVNLDDRIWKK